MKESEEAAGRHRESGAVGLGTLLGVAEAVEQGMGACNSRNIAFRLMLVSAALLGSTDMTALSLVKALMSHRSGTSDPVAYQH